MLKKYFYKLLFKYLSLYIRPDNYVLEVNPFPYKLSANFSKYKVLFLNQLAINSNDSDSIEYKDVLKTSPEYVLLNGNIHYEKDIQVFLTDIHKIISPAARVIIIYYNSLWRPLIKLATYLGIRTKTPELNWVAPEDMDNFLRLTDYEIVRRDNKVLMPIYIPLISHFINRYIAPLPFFRLFSLVNIIIAKPLYTNAERKSPTVSIVVPARNEAGNIENIIKRIPAMSNNDEIIFVEGNSTDNTWQTLEEMYSKYKDEKNILIVKQDGKGKADAVRKGFSIASRDILMILDADLTVPAEDLPKFYNAIADNKGEFINGSRLVYPMEKEAMRFFNMVGNKFFAIGFSFVLGQRFKDTLCGTKVITRVNYEKLARYRTYFGDFDPFGDFDLIFGAARLNLRIVEVPISYKERTYGSTNIQRWKHGVILLRMLLFAARKFKFI